MNQAQIETVISLTSPLHISAPGGCWYNWDGLGRFIYSKPGPGEKGTISTITRTRTMRMPALGEMSSAPDTEDAFGRTTVEVPEIPSNSIRGMFRRAAADIVLDAFAKKGTKVSLDVFHMLTCGAVTGNPDGEPPAVPEIQESASHVFLGLFGGGPRFIRGALRVSQGLPICQETVARGMVTDRPQLKAASNYLTRAMMMRRVDDIVGWVPQKAAATISDFEASVKKWLEDNTAKGKGEEESTDSRGLKAFSGFEFVMPGTSFEFRLMVDGRRDAQVGLAILALCKLFNDQRIGGKGSIGCGQYQVQIGESTITVDGLKHRYLAPRVEKGLYQPDMENPEIAAFINAAKEELDALSIERLEWLSRRPATKEAVKKGKE